MTSGAKTLRRLSVALLGGMRASGPLRVGDRVARVSLIGGIDLDLTEATFEAPTLTIVKVSLIDGVDLRLPPDAPEIVVQSVGLVGGVKLRRAATHQSFTRSV